MPPKKKNKIFSFFFDLSRTKKKKKKSKKKMQSKKSLKMKSSKKEFKEEKTEKQEKRLCEDLKCAVKDCSVEKFLKQFGEKRKKDEDLIDFIKRMGFSSSHSLFPFWTKKLNPTKNRIHKAISNSSRLVEGVNYVQIDSKKHPNFFKMAKSKKECPETSWSIFYIDQKLFSNMIHKLLTGKFEVVPGLHELNTVQKIFKAEKELVTFEEFKPHAELFWCNFPVWKEIFNQMKELKIEHKMIGNGFMEKLIKMTLSILSHKLNQQESKEQISAVPPIINSSFAINKKLAKMFFFAFSGIAYTLQIHKNPFVPEKIKKEKAFVLESYSQDFIFHWCGGSMMLMDQSQSKKMLSNSHPGTYFLRICGQFVWDIASKGLQNVFKQMESKTPNPFFVCYIDQNNEYCEKPFKMQSSLSHFLGTIGEIDQCFICKTTCYKEMLEKFHLQSNQPFLQSQSVFKEIMPSVISIENPNSTTDKRTKKRPAQEKETPPRRKNLVIGNKLLQNDPFKGKSNFFFFFFIFFFFFFFFHFFSTSYHI